MHPQVNIVGIKGIPEVEPGDDLVDLIIQATEAQGTPFQQGDVLVVTQKVVSKAEGRIIKLDDIKPSPTALQFAHEHNKDPRHIEIILQESRHIIRMERGLIISETYHGFKCANAGIDMSNMPDTRTACLLPKDPDASARYIRVSIEKLHDIRVAVIISDSFGRPWREGIVNVAIGTSGLDPLRNLRKTKDAYGHPLQSTVVAVADELAAAAGMVMAKDSNIPVALIKGYAYNPKEQRASILLRPHNQDLFL